jgi:hypothetical protein
MSATKCVGFCTLVVLACLGFAGTICTIVYLSMALDHEPANDVACPSNIRDWTIGFLALMCLNLGSWLTGTTKSLWNTDDTTDENQGGLVGLVALGSFAMAIASPVVIAKDLRGVCPHTKYEEAFEVVFWYYVTTDVLMLVIGVGACIAPCALAACGSRECESVSPRGFV